MNVTDSYFIEEREYNRIKNVNIKWDEKFNFAFDCLDVIAKQYPLKTALVYVN